MTATIVWWGWQAVCRQVRGTATASFHAPIRTVSFCSQYVPLYSNTAVLKRIRCCIGSQWSWCHLLRSPGPSDETGSSVLIYGALAFIVFFVSSFYFLFLVTNSRLCWEESEDGGVDGMTIRVYLHSFSRCWLLNLRNPTKFRENGQDHPRSSISMSIESAYGTSY